MKLFARVTTIFTASLTLALLLLPCAASAQEVNLGSYTRILAQALCSHMPTTMQQHACSRYLYYRFDQRYEKSHAEQACEHNFCLSDKVSGPQQGLCRDVCQSMLDGDN